MGLGVLRILVVHNSYQQRGGEDSVVESEIALLRAHGNDVVEYCRSNDELKRIGRFDSAAQALWSRRTMAELMKLFVEKRPDIIHVHNTFPLVSPSLYWAAAKARVPVVQTLHNFRLMCLNGLFLRDAQVCEECLGHLPWRGVIRRCYRGDGAASGVLAAMLTLHRGLKTYSTKVARYIVLNDFCRRKFIEGGLPADLMVIKPNFVDFDEPEVLPRQGLLFVGRVSAEKGIQTLVEAAALLPHARLRVVGSGPDNAKLDGLGNITHLGSLPGAAVQQEMNRALALVVPSIWYETFGLVIVEAFASGTPVIASRIGVLTDLVREGETGICFEPGNAQDLADKIHWALAHPKQMAQMGRNARVQYVAEFSAEENYRLLTKIYVDVLNEYEKTR